jgi:serine/threonine protein kinase
MAQLLQPKQQLAGYEISELVGKGGMGEVYRARQISMDRMVALKILAPRLANQDPIFAKRFVDEARAAGRLNHPNIIAVHDVGKAPMPGVAAGTEPDLDYFSMEFVDGESVKDVIDRQGICPLSLVVQVIQGMTEALVYAEAQGIVHRDIKPDNIMITNSGVVKLADLGLALQLGGEEIVSEKDEMGRSKVMGTPLYMSPEQARALSVDSRSDQYSLGATLFHMLTGKPPFRGENAKLIMRSHVYDPVPDPKQLNPDVPEGWRQLTMRLMAKMPEERFPNAIAMRAALQAVVTGVGIGNSAVSRRVRTSYGHVKGHSEAMPKWAKQLVYGFAAAVILMVAIYVIPWGGNTSHDKNSGDSNALTPRDSQVIAQNQVERVRAAISALPADHEKAIAALTQLAADNTITASSARELIEREKSTRVAALKQSPTQQGPTNSQQVQTQLAAQYKELELAWTAGDLAETSKLVTILNAQANELSSEQRVQVENIQSKIKPILAKLQKTFTEQIEAATNSEKLNALTTEIEASPLPSESKTVMNALITKRANGLTNAAPQTASDDRAQWLALNARLEELRGDVSYAKVNLLVKELSPTFNNPDNKSKVLALTKLGALAMKAEVALRHYILQVNPIVDVVWENKSVKVKLLELSSTLVSFMVQEGSGVSEEKISRRLVRLPLAKLLQDLPDDPEFIGEDRVARLAAFLWYWRVPEANDLFGSIPKHELSQAVFHLSRMALQPTMPPQPTLQVKMVKAGNQVTATYDGSRNPWYLTDFIGDGAQIVPKGLAWSTTVVANGQALESALPTLKWAGSLRPPFVMTAQIMLQPKTEMLLLGVMSGEKTIRVAISNMDIPNRATLVMTRSDSSRFGTPPNFIDITGFFKPTVPQKVEIRVDADYRVTLLLNDNDTLSDGQSFKTKLKLPTGGAITPVIQAIMDKTQQTSTVITSLVISGIAAEE